MINGRKWCRITGLDCEERFNLNATCSIKLRLGGVLGANPDLSSHSAPGKIRQSFKHSSGSTEMIDELTKRHRTDIFGANKPQASQSFRPIKWCNRQRGAGWALVGTANSSVLVTYATEHAMNHSHRATR